MDLARMVYAQSARMPAEERFGLTNQMRRAAVSVPSNIAEGYGRQSLADYLKHLRIARGSVMELDTQLELAISMDMIPNEPQLLNLLAETGRVLHGLIQGLEGRK